MNDFTPVDNYEPIQFRIAEGTIEAFLAERGYSMLDLSIWRPPA
jgi:hypothetical protein